MKKSFYSLTRGYTATMSICPFVVVLCCAIKTVPVDMLFCINAFLLLLGIVLVHLATNLFDDYIDIKKQLQNGLSLNEINFKNQKKARMILNGAYTMAEVKNIIISFCAVSAIIGVYFILIRNFNVLLYMAIAGILSSFYPVSSKYGLSELVVGAVFGPVLVNGSYFVLTGIFDPQVYNLSIAIGIMTTILLIAHSLMDYEFDINAGKKTIPVLLKNKNLTINLISLLIIASYGILIYTSAKYGMKSLLLLPIIATIPIAIKLVLSLYDYIQIKDVEFKPKWYFGKMENWEEIKENHFEYFMYRFYLARNLSVIFSLALAINCLFTFRPISLFGLQFLPFFLNLWF